MNTLQRRAVKTLIKQMYPDIPEVYNGRYDLIVQILQRAKEQYRSAVNRKPVGNFWLCLEVQYISDDLNCKNMGRYMQSWVRSGLSGSLTLQGSLIIEARLRGVDLFDLQLVGLSPNSGTKDGLRLRLILIERMLRLAETKVAKETIK